LQITTFVRNAARLYRAVPGVNWYDRLGNNG